MPRLWSLPRWIRVLLVLLLALGPVAQAKDISNDQKASECQTLSSASSVGSKAGGNRVNLETFVPDPICWLQGNRQAIEKYKLYDWSKGIAVGLVVMGMGLALLTIATNRRKALQQIVVGALCFGMISNYGTGGGAWMMTSVLNQAWDAGYSASANIGQNMLNESTLQGAKALGSKFGQYIASTAHLKVIEKAMKTAALAPSATTDGLDQAYQNIVVKADLNEDTTNSNPIWGGLAGITYFLILAMFTVFAIMVYAGGFLMLMIGILMPIVFATCVFGNFAPVLGVGKLGIGSVLVITLLPIVLGLTTKTMLTSPIQTLSDSLDYSITETNNRITSYKATVDKCYDLNAKACLSTATGYGTLQTDTLGFIQDSIIGLGLGVFAVLAAFSVAVAQLRRIPALVFQVLGAAGGGGESSGAYSPPGARQVSAAVGSAARKGAELVATRGGSGVKQAGSRVVAGAGAGSRALPSSSSGPSVRSVTVTQEPKPGRALPRGK